MDNLVYQVFAIDVLMGLTSNSSQTNFSYKNKILRINGKPSFSCSIWPDTLRTTRAKYFLEKADLAASDITTLGFLWMQALQKKSLSGQQLKNLGVKARPVAKADESILHHWRSLLEARLLENMPNLEYVEQLSFEQLQQTDQPLELNPLLHSWPDRLLNHSRWSCAESPLPEIPPLPLDSIWVDLHVTESLEQPCLEDYSLAQAMEQRYRKSQWANRSADIVLESLQGTTVLIGAPGIGKTTLMKWIARRLIKQPEGRFLLPLFVSLRAYALEKTQRPDRNLLDYSFRFCGVKSDTQAQKWSAVMSYLSAPDRNTTLLLLDGWDEVPQNMREILISEIQKLSDNFSIIITSRPSAYPSALPADQIYEVLDLSSESIVSLIQRWHKVMQHPEKADILLTHFQKYPDLLTLARNPFLVNLLCAINRICYTKNKRLPRNRTELYSDTLEYIYTYQSHKYPSSPFTRQHIEQAQKLALWLLADSPNSPQYLFGAEEVQHITSDIDVLAKVLSPSRLLSQWHIDKESLHFLHTSFQEYLAAEALLKLDKDKRIRFIKRELYNPAWQEIFRFIAGKNTDEHHDFWKIMRQLAEEPDQYGLITVRLAQLIAETGKTDGGQSLLDCDLRERIREHIKNGMNIEHFMPVYKQLETNSTDRYTVNNVLDKPSPNIPNLRQTLQNKTLSINTQQRLIRTIGYHKDYISIPYFIQLYKKTPDLREEIVKALGNIGGKKAGNTLARMLQTTADIKDRQAIIKALACAFDLPARDILLMELAKIMPDDPLLKNILAAFCGMPLSNHSELVSLYLAPTFSENIRVNAIAALIKATETDITEKLIHLVKSDHSEKVRIKALAALRKRARSSDFLCLNTIVENKAYSSVERAKALEAIFGLYKRALQGQIYHLSPSFLHKKIVKLTKFSLQEPLSEISISAAKGAYILGKEIAPLLLNVCEYACKHPHEFSNSVREAACISLGKIQYKPATALLNSWINKSPELLNIEEKSLMNTDERLASAAAQAFVQIDLQTAIHSQAKTVRTAVSQFALKKGYFIFSDRMITPNSRVIEYNQNQYNNLNAINMSLRLDPNKKASEQEDKLRAICKNLLSTGNACQTSRYPNQKPFALFKKAEYSSGFERTIDVNTGRKLLKGGSISPQSANKLAQRLKTKFRFVFIDH